MRLFTKTKDGGLASTVDAYFLIEIKNLFSIALLKFSEGSRENYHSHAFNALTWFLSGDMVEIDKDGTEKKYKKSWLPKFTSKNKTHKVYANKPSWCLTLRGPWSSVWTEYNEQTNRTYYLTHGRKVLANEKEED